MALTNACEAWSVRAGGEITERAGYGPAFLAAAVVSLLALPLLLPLRGGGAGAPRGTAGPIDR
jgi:hypothetical protein